MKKFFNKNQLYFVLIFSSLILILPGWFLSFIYFPEEITLKIINDISDSAYFPLIKSFSEFNFSNSYSEKIQELDIVSFPIISLFVNSFFFKIFGIHSFIILKLVCTFLFILIFYKIFTELNFKKIYSLLFALFLFVLPIIIRELSLLNFSLLELLALNFETFYSLRFPRPIITNLFFFTYIFYLIKFYKDDHINKKNLFAISILMGLSLNSFFYLFFIEFFSFLLVFLIKFKEKTFFYLIKNFRIFVFCFISLIFFVTIFQIQIYLSEPDYIKRLGVFDINLDQKKKLIEYLISFFADLRFLLIILLNLTFFYLNKNHNLKIFFYIFLGSILSPIFFFIFLSKGVDYYHFFNWIIVLGFLYPIIIILEYFEKIISYKFNVKNQKKILFISIFFVFLIFNHVSYKNFQFEKVNNRNERFHLNDVVNFILNDHRFKSKNIEIFNLNFKLSVWLMINDYNNFSLVPVSFWTPKKDYMIENELFSTANFFNLDNDDFFQIIKNKKKDWRYKNLFVFSFFGRKYLANSLVAFNNNYSDYEVDEEKFINSNNLLKSHQVIIPKSEIKRLLKDYENHEIIITPEMVIIDNLNHFTKENFKREDYCSIFKNQRFEIFYNFCN